MTINIESKKEHSKYQEPTPIKQVMKSIYSTAENKYLNKKKMHQNIIFQSQKYAVFLLIKFKFLSSDLVDYTQLQFQVQLLAMINMLFREEILQIFEKSDCPNIFDPYEQYQLTLQTLQPGPQNINESIKAMKSIAVALVSLKLTLLTPCQLKYSYVVKVGEQWGLRYAICSRNEELLEEGEDTYNPEQYKRHKDAQNQLIWNLGKIWLRFFTKAKISIYSTPQQEINAIIKKSVLRKDIQTALLYLLDKEEQKRPTFEAFLAFDTFFESQNYSAMMASVDDSSDSRPFPSSCRLYSSLIVHFRNISVMHSTSGQNKNLAMNPFTRELYYRMFMEYLEVDNFMQGVIRSLKEEYYLQQDEEQKAICDFSFYMIMLQNYKNMAEIHRRRMNIEMRLDEGKDRTYFSKFTTRLFQMKEIILKKKNKLMHNKVIPTSLHQYLGDPDQLDNELIYNQFKQRLNQYATHLKKNLNQNPQNIIYLKLLVKIFMARTASYLFLQNRREIFEPFVDKYTSFKIKNVLYRIEECNRCEPLQKLLKNIKNCYFSP